MLPVPLFLSSPAIDLKVCQQTISPRCILRFSQIQSGEFLCSSFFSRLLTYLSSNLFMYASLKCSHLFWCSHRLIICPVPRTCSPFHLFLFSPCVNPLMLITSTMLVTLRYGRVDLTFERCAQLVREYITFFLNHRKSVQTTIIMNKCYLRERLKNTMYRE